MKNILIIALIFFIYSCTLSSKTIEEVKKRPTLELGFNYFNDYDFNNIFNEIEVVNLYIYREDTLYNIHEVEKSYLKENSTYVPLYGVKEGNYRVIALANMNNEVITKKVELLNSAYMYMSNSINHLTTFSPILFADSSYTVLRGGQQLHYINLKKKYNKIKLLIKSIPGLNMYDLRGLNLKVINTPTSMAFLGDHLNESETIYPPVFPIGNEEIYYSSSFNLYDLNEYEKGYIELYIYDELLCTVSFSDIKKTDYWRNIKGNKDIVLNMDLVINALSTSIHINNWYMFDVENIKIGN